MYIKIYIIITFESLYRICMTERKKKKTVLYLSTKHKWVIIGKWHLFYVPTLYWYKLRVSAFLHMATCHIHFKWKMNKKNKFVCVCWHFRWTKRYCHIHHVEIQITEMSRILLHFIYLVFNFIDLINLNMKKKKLLNSNFSSTHVTCHQFVSTCINVPPTSWKTFFFFLYF